MAKENIVSLRGYVQTDPKIYINTDGEPVKAEFRLVTIKRIPDPDLVKEVTLSFSQPKILSKNPKMIKRIEGIKAGDFVEITGVLTTKLVLKSKLCPNPDCKERGIKNSVEGSATYVTPIYIEATEHGLSKEEAIELLKKRSEVSNIFRCIGALVRDPDFYFNPENGRKSCQYQIAINRRYTIKEDGPEIKTDYPWVKTYGEQALEDSEALREGSVVYINGFLRSREATRKLVCSECGQEYEFTDQILEINPWGVEFLFKNNTEEPQKNETVDVGTYAEDGLAGYMEDSAYNDIPDGEDE